MVRICGVVCLVSGCLATDGWAGSVGRGGYAGAYQGMGLGARAMAMGGGSAALADDGYGFFYNPAGLVFLQGRHLTTSLKSMALDRRLYHLGYAQAVGGGKRGLPRAGLAVGWICPSRMVQCATCTAGESY